uniref:Lysosome-associated membrane glycoprotein 2-like luminal domain-containing protein n=1 Tax=Seriola dumerili TaxID=41447 RepID=A0A3B4UVY5_SERDU
MHVCVHFVCMSVCVLCTGTYMLQSLAGKPCIKATMGAEYIVIEKKKTWYFNLDPSRVRTSGYCGKESALLSVTLILGFLNQSLYFCPQENNVSYVTKLSARVSPLPVYKTYSGLLDHYKLFTTANGQSFKCKSDSLLLMSSELRIKLVHLQMQAFTLPNGQYGEEVECWADFNKRVVPIVIGATVVGFILITVLTLLFIKDRRSQGYDRL